MQLSIVGCPDKERFRPYVKRAVNFYTNELISKKLSENIYLKIKFNKELDVLGDSDIKSWNLEVKKENPYRQGSIITEKIDKFYNKSFKDHEKVLFDKNGISISEYNSYANSQIVAGSNKSNFPLYPLNTENKCFQNVSKTIIILMHSYLVIKFLKYRSKIYLKFT